METTASVSKMAIISVAVKILFLSTSNSLACSGFGGAAVLATESPILLIRIAAGRLTVNPIINEITANPLPLVSTFE